MTDYDKAEIVKNLIQALIGKATFSSTVTYEDSLSRGLVFNISSRESRSLIGRQGVTLHALEILIHAIVAKHFAGDIFRFSVDVDDYKIQREWALKQLAKDAVEKLKATGRQVTLEPMANYDRRVVHAYLQDNFDDVMSSSEGREPDRRVVITLR